MKRITRLELGDVLIFFYVLVFVRQYFWIVDNNVAAWILTTIVSTIIWYGYVVTRQFQSDKFGTSFWLVVGVPLLIAYLIRAAFPDRSFDVLTYHLLQGERSLRGPLFQPGDFFHSVPFNPAPDTITALSRTLLGFRLGTIINLLVMIWAAQLVDKTLRDYIDNSWLRSFAVLVIVLIENVVFEISSYMVDLLMLPLLLQATLLTLRSDEAKNRLLNFTHIAFLLGAAMSLKLTTLAVAIPIFAICGFKMVVGPQSLKPRQILITCLAMFAAFLAPFAAFTAYIYKLTGNPVFPVANGFFNSPYWPVSGGWDNRWGPHTFWETIGWPILIWFNPERYSELGVYSGRLSFGFIIAFVGLVLAWKHRTVRTLCLLLIVSSFLWSLSALGYSRYGIYQDLLAGIVVVVVIAKLPLSKRWQTLVASLCAVILVAQFVLSWKYSLQTEWGLRTTVIKDPDLYLREAKSLLRDHSLTSFLRGEDKNRFEQVRVWFETGQKSTGFEVLLNPVAPIIAMRQPEFFLTRESWRKFISTVESGPQTGMYSICLKDDLVKAKQIITERGLETGEVISLDLSFFSTRDPIGIMLIEIHIPQDPTAREQFATAWMKGAFGAADYREQIVAENPPTTMHVGEKLDVALKVKNLGSATWTAVGTKDFRYQIDLGNHWIKDGNSSEDNRAVMKTDLGPGAETDLKMVIMAPSNPGNYILEFDMVHEGVTWFKERGAKPLSIRVNVQP